VTVGRLTVGGNGSAPKPAPAQTPSSPSTNSVGRSKETERRGIHSDNADRSLSVSVMLKLRKKTDVPLDYYEVLGVRRDADQGAIKRAFRSRSRELHPDVSRDPDAESRFRALNEAYDVLGRPESRRLYDRFGWRGRGNGFEKRSSRVYTSSPRGLLQDLESLIMSAAGRRVERRPTRVVGSVEVDPYEAHVGTTKAVALDEPRSCAACEGIGGEVLTCSTCRGTGRQRIVSESDAGRLLRLETCDACAGSGRIPARACPECGGRGVDEEERAVDVPVPPRVRDLDRVPVGPQEVAIVKIVRARERFAVRAAAFAGLLVALGFLLFLLSL
jgi:molecular chaperone DnaJ